MNAVESNITVSGNPFDLTDEEAEAALALELEVFGRSVVIASDR